MLLREFELIVSDNYLNHLSIYLTVLTAPKKNELTDVSEYKKQYVPVEVILLVLSIFSTERKTQKISFLM